MIKVGSAVNLIMHATTAYKHADAITRSIPNSSDAASGAVDLELFVGNWELRIAYDGWDLGAGLYVAHPAVRGSLQLYANDTWTPRQYFAPCPNAAECRSQWVKGRYLSNCEAFVGYEPLDDDYYYGYGDREPSASTLGQNIEWYNLEQELWCDGYSDPVADVTDDFSVDNHGKILTMLLHTQPGFNYSGTFGAIAGGYQPLGEPRDNNHGAPRPGRDASCEGA